jgi:exodeoxyribonuclease-3
MKIISWNVNGLRAIMKKNFSKFLKEHNPDILCLQEIKTNQPQSFLNLDYKIYWNFAEKKGYSGTAVFTKKEPLSVEHALSDKEGRVLTLEFENFFLVNVYVPNSGRELKRLDYREKWDKKFRNYLEKLKEDKPVICCGDFNVAHQEIDLANPKSNYNKTAGYTQTEIDDFTKLLDKGFIDIFREKNPEKVKYTYWSYMHNAREKNIGWRIDYFIISPKIKSKVKDTEILTEVMGSDHCPIYLILK